MIRTLHLDIEGGYGGSSRSLYQLVSRLPRDRIEPFVVHRQAGPVTERYARIGVATEHLPSIASFVPREGGSIRNLAASAPRFLRIREAARRIGLLIEQRRIDLVHLNYEGLFVLGALLRRRHPLPIVCHFRAMLPRDGWGRALVRTLGSVCDHYFFISPNEEARVRGLESRRRVPGEVLWNIAPGHPGASPPFDPPTAVYLGSIDRQKGTDRLLDVAAALEGLRAPPLRLAIYGESRTDPAFLRALRARLQRERLEDRVSLEGFTDQPERVLSRALALVRPSRTDDPWGRDVIEATAFGVPVIATGSFAGIVEPEVTGWLHDPFDAEAAARQLLLLLGQPALRRRMSEAAAEKGALLFGGSAQAARVTDVFEALVQGRPTAAQGSAAE